MNGAVITFIIVYPRWRYRFVFKRLKTFVSVANLLKEAQHV
ncbi:MAG: hypothetical protein ACUVX8_00650 [Candidatus Zipacnadales bacterium]